MFSNQDLKFIFDRIANGDETEGDMQNLRQLLHGREGQSSIKIGKYIVNIPEGRDIQIGDRTYYGADAEAIKEALPLVLQEKQKAQRPRNEKMIIFPGIMLASSTILQSVSCSSASVDAIALSTGYYKNILPQCLWKNKDKKRGN